MLGAYLLTRANSGGYGSIVVIMIDARGSRFYHHLTIIYALSFLFPDH